MARGADVHRSAVIFDGTCPMWGGHEYVAHWIEGGVTVMAPTVAGVFDDCASAMKQIGQWLTFLERRDDLLHVTKAEHFCAAKNAGKLGVLFHFQNASPIERDIELVRVFAELGARVVQLCMSMPRRSAVQDPANSRRLKCSFRLIRRSSRRS